MIGIERLLMLFQSRKVSVDLPIGLERRLKAALHRMNGEIATSGLELELFDIDRDLPAALISAAERGIEEMERDSGVKYDFVTGDPIALGMPL